MRFSLKWPRAAGPFLAAVKLEGPAGCPLSSRQGFCLLLILIRAVDDPDASKSSSADCGGGWEAGDSLCRLRRQRVEFDFERLHTRRHHVGRRAAAPDRAYQSNEIVCPARCHQRRRGGAQSHRGNLAQAEHRAPATCKGGVVQGPRSRSASDVQRDLPCGLRQRAPKRSVKSSNVTFGLLSLTRRNVRNWRTRSVQPTAASSAFSPVQQT